MDATNKRVGIGTGSPSTKLHVVTGTGVAAKLFLENTATSQVSVNMANTNQYTRLITESGNVLRVYDQTDGQSRLTIDTNGRVGIATTTPRGILDVASSTTGSSLFVVKDTGRVGIGTSIPSYGIDVEKANGKTFAAFGSLYPTYITGNSPYIGFNLYYTTEWHMGKGSAGNYGGVIGLEPSSGDFRVFTSPSGSEGDIIDLGGYERIRIQQNGNVGIGTTSPGEKLEVEGKIKFGTQLAGENYQGILDTVDTISEGSESRDDVMITTDGGVIIKADKNNNGISGMGAFAVYDNTSHLFTITEAGNVGIGTTNPTARLHLDGKTFLLNDSDWYSLGWNTNAGNGGGTAIVMCSNNYDDGARTRSAVYMLRAGFDGDNVAQVLIAESNGGDMFTFRSNGGTLEVKGWDSLVGLTTGGRCEVIAMD